MRTRLNNALRHEVAEHGENFANLVNIVLALVYSHLVLFQLQEFSVATRGHHTCHTGADIAFSGIKPLGSPHLCNTLVSCSVR